MNRFMAELPGFTMLTAGTGGSRLRLQQLKKRRKLWLSVHLWLGLLLGFFIALFGLTGSILVFYQEIDNVLNADLRQVEAPAEGERAYLPFASIQAAAAATMPAEAKLGFVDYPDDDSTSFKFGFNTASESGDGRDIWHVHVNPYTAKVLGKHLIRRAGDSLPKAFIPFIFQLHFSLLAGDTGGIVAGVMAVVLVFSLLTGLIVWWPLTGSWRRVFTVKARASNERLNHDLHQISGIYTVPVLLAVLVSGVYMNLPDQFMALVKQLSPETEGRLNNLHSDSVPGKAPVGLAEALERIRGRYPEGRIDWLSLPAEKNGIYLINIAEVPGLTRFWSERRVAVDQYSGEILAVHDPGNRKSAGQTFIDWQWPLHSGRAFGWTGRIVVFIAGLACPVLFVTGVIRWLQKRRAKRHRHAGA